MLARFRADPGKVRVAIRREGSVWLATVSSLVTSSKCGIRRFVAYATGQRKALVRALRMAEAAGLEGVDLDMSWTYEHPQHAQVVRLAGRGRR
jgi:hypothetical protein